MSENKLIDGDQLGNAIKIIEKKMRIIDDGKLFPTSIRIVLEALEVKDAELAQTKAALAQKDKEIELFQRATSVTPKGLMYFLALEEKVKALEVKALAMQGVFEALKAFKTKFEAFHRYQQQHLTKGLEAAEQSWAEVSDAGMLDFADLFNALKAIEAQEKK